MYFVRHGQSEFNLAMHKTGRDPSIFDAPLTPLGFEQAKQAAKELARMNVKHLISSPYTRALQTASAIADELGLRIQVEALVGERSVYSCDIGTPLVQLRAKWPTVDFAHLEIEQWWPENGESHSNLVKRVALFKTKWGDVFRAGGVALVSHWYFLHNLTGHDFKNGEVLASQVFSKRSTARIGDRQFN